MLEHASMQVGPWMFTDTTWVRRVTDGAGGPLGFVRYSGKGASSWWSWLRRVKLEVFETEDASHLMTIIRPWGFFRVWDVYDAEGRCVGAFYPPSVVDSDGERRGILDQRGVDGPIIVDLAGKPLAAWRGRGAPMLEASFTPDPAGNPFLRMLLLAAILVQDATPP